MLWCIVDILNYFSAAKKRKKGNEAVYPQVLHFSRSTNAWHRKGKVRWKLSPRALQNVTTDAKATEEALKWDILEWFLSDAVRYFTSIGTADKHTKVTWMGVKLKGLLVLVTAFIGILKICLLGKGWMSIFKFSPKLPHPIFNKL